MGNAAQVARSCRLVLLAQVHSHPGTDTRHSDGDDDMVLMPFEGMFSVVVGRYGDDDATPAEGAGVHQFQDSAWVSVSDAASSVVVVPTVMYP
ncbi:MAG: hypothetical protein ACT4OM_00685 [Actinomycetota bacterium]